jgi:hypothetical protein
VGPTGNEGEHYAHIHVWHAARGRQGHHQRPARLAKTFRTYPKRQRARDAASWIRGEVTVTPTIKLAASVFGISPPLMKAQLDRRRGGDYDRDHRRPARAGQTHGNGSGNASQLSDDVVERIVAEVGVDRIWRVVEKLTQPQLPLQAAE